MNNFRPIAMRCTKKEYLSIRDFIVKHVDKSPVDNNYFLHLSNNFNGEENKIGFVAGPHSYNREVYEQFCAKTFLNACGFDVEQNVKLEWQVKWQLKDHAENEYLKNINVLKTLIQENDALRQEIKELKEYYKTLPIIPIETKFEVIEIYPDSPFKIGDTLERYFSGWGTGDPQTFVRYPHFYPHLFKQIN